MYGNQPYESHENTPRQCLLIISLDINSITLITIDIVELQIEYLGYARPFVLYI